MANELILNKLLERAILSVKYKKKLGFDKVSRLRSHLIIVVAEAVNQESVSGP